MRKIRISKKCIVVNLDEEEDVSKLENFNVRKLHYTDSESMASYPFYFSVLLLDPQDSDEVYLKLMGFDILTVNNGLNRTNANIYLINGYYFIESNQFYLDMDFIDKIIDV